MVSDKNLLAEKGSGAVQDDTKTVIVTAGFHRNSSLVCQGAKWTDPLLSLSLWLAGQLGEEREVSTPDYVEPGRARLVN